MLSTPEYGIRHDVLEDALHHTRVATIRYGRTVSAGRWGFSVPAGEAAGFTIVRSGSAWLDVEGSEERYCLYTGDVVIFPHGNAHAYRDDPATPAPLLFELLKQHSVRTEDRSVYFGGSGATTTLICGGFWFESRRTNPLLQTLPLVIRLTPQARADYPALESQLDAIEAEVLRGQPGSRAIMARAAEMLFMHAVRAHILRSRSDGVGWLSALRDARVGSALARIHAAPEQEWTVEELASLVGMSRSALAHEFSRVVGESPMQYVTRLRMQRAVTLLNLGNGKLADIGETVGYKSEAAFRRTFKRILGVSPGVFRRRVIGPEAAASPSAK